MKRVFPKSFYNPITLVGAAIGAVSFGLILFLMLLETLAETPKPYMGIIAFVILPGILLIGLFVVIAGIVRAHSRERAGLQAAIRMPQIDLNNPQHRRAFVLFSLGAILLLLFSAFGSFQAYEATDSNQFCGQTCHTVMEPEYTAYQFSPHARVGCVQCHIGPGADWFVRSKISGTYQVYATLLNKYPRPIPTPIKNLRPAQETCEQCHWPKQFYGDKLLVHTYFETDEKNTRWTLDLLMKIGGGNIETGPTSGIHWHMNIANVVTYAALDSARQQILWVRSKRSDGDVTEYRSTELTADSAAQLAERRMDCIDCHNRPTHIYHPSARSVNRVMELGWIDPSLPDVKSVTVGALDQPYSSKEVALDSIRIAIEEHYRTTYPEVAAAKHDAIERTIGEVQKIYSRNYFPAMRVSWRNFTDNVGHLYYPGCFRCHDGKHVADDGKVLSKDCNVCHVIVAQHFQNDTTRVALGGVEYHHPVDIGDAWKDTNCSDCHNPG